MLSRLVGVVAMLSAALWSSLALAAPARVKVFEAEARAAADATAKVVHVFPEGAPVSVSEQAENGWRKVRLPDGGVAFIRDDQIALQDAAVATAAVASPVRASARPAPKAHDADAEGEDQDEVVPPARTVPVKPLAPPSRRPQARDDDAPRGRAGKGTEGRAVTIYVTSLSHFAELVKGDAIVAQKADSLLARRNWGIGLSAAGMVAGITLIAGASTFLASESCTAEQSGPQCHSKTNDGVLLAGAIVAAAANLPYALLWPRSSEILELINTWNTRHPYQQFEIERGASRRDD